MRRNHLDLLDHGRRSRGARKSARLSLEHVLVSVIIADRRKHGSVGRQRYSGERRAIEIEARLKFARDMPNVPGAAAIARDERLAASAGISRKPASRLESRP